MYVPLALQAFSCVHLAQSNQDAGILPGVCQKVAKGYTPRCGCAARTKLRPTDVQNGVWLEKQLRDSGRVRLGHRDHHLHAMPV